VGCPPADEIRQDLAEHDEALAVPCLLDIGVMSALRVLAQVQRIDSHHAGELLADLANLPAKRYERTPLLGRIWELHHISRPTTRSMLLWQKPPEVSSIRKTANSWRGIEPKPNYLRNRSSNAR
jgi:hypothetical protein